MQLTSQQIRAIVEAEAAQRNLKFTATVEKWLAPQLGVAPSGLYRYIADGLPVRMNRVVREKIEKLARAHGVLDGQKVSQK